MTTFKVVCMHIFSNSLPCFSDIVVLGQIGFLVLETPEPSFNHYIISPAAFTIHALTDLVLFEKVHVLIACELTALIRKKALGSDPIKDTPFVVINADDYYGKEGFKKVHEYLVNGGTSCMAGFVLKNPLSDNGGVTCGICKMDEENNFTEVVETHNIMKTADGAEADGVKVDTESLVSMNMWGLTPDFVETLEKGFEEFFEKEVPGNPMKAEFLIPSFIGELLEQGKISVKVLRTNDSWYGMTYKEDVEAVKDSFKNMFEKEIYKTDLFADL